MAAKIILKPLPNDSNMWICPLKKVRTNSKVAPIIKSCQGKVKHFLSIYADCKSLIRRNPAKLIFDGIKRIEDLAVLFGYFFAFDLKGRRQLIVFDTKILRQDMKSLDALKIGQTGIDSID